MEPVLDIFQNHNYLAYFPAYSTTSNFLRAITQHEELLSKFIQALMISPLIKINRCIIDQFLTILDNQELPQGIFSMIVKLLVQRSSLKLINQEIS
ncbi:MAG: hypothetical protein KDD45_02035 [Bdellovibrionales bacterium]|nr:hypothetical protein [Bdellovibrionales bacterium]